MYYGGFRMQLNPPEVFYFWIWKFQRFLCRLGIIHSYPANPAHMSCDHEVLTMIDAAKRLKAQIADGEQHGA